MKKLVILFLLITPSIGWLQRSLSKTELPKELMLIQIEAGGQRLFSVKYQGACIAYNKNSGDFFLYGDVNGKDIIFLNKVQNVGMHFYPENYMSCHYEDGKVYLVSQRPGWSTIVTGVFAWEKEDLFYEKETESDISLDQTNRAKELVKNGHILEAIATYDSVKYSENYYDAEIVSIELILGSAKSIEHDVAHKHYKQAAEWASKVLDFKGFKWATTLKSDKELQDKIGKSYHGLNLHSFQLFIESCITAFDGSKQFDKSVEFGRRYITLFPNSTSILLCLGNGYYEKNDKDQAIEYYDRYIILMHDHKKDKDIPSYVPGRISQ